MILSRFLVACFGLAEVTSLLGLEGRLACFLLGWLSWFSWRGGVRFCFFGFSWFALARGTFLCVLAFADDSRAAIWVRCFVKRVVREGE